MLPVGVVPAAIHIRLPFPPVSLYPIELIALSTEMKKALFSYALNCTGRSPSAILCAF